MGRPRWTHHCPYCEELTGEGHLVPASLGDPSFTTCDTTNKREQDRGITKRRDWSLPQAFVRYPHGTTQGWEGQTRMDEFVALAKDERVLLEAALMLVTIDEQIVQLVDADHLAAMVKQRKWWRERFDYMYDEISDDRHAALIRKLER